MTQSHNQTRINRESPCQCTACREWFTSLQAFDMHRRGIGLERRCNLNVQTSEDGYRLMLVEHSNGTAWRWTND